VVVPAEPLPSRRDSEMWIIAGYCTIDATERDAFIAEHRDLIRRARQAPGCLDVAITPDPVDPERVYNLERWESWEAVEAWRRVAAAPVSADQLREVHVLAYEVARECPPF